MGSLKIGWSAMGALLIAIVVIAVLVCARFRRDTEAAQERSQSGGSQAIETGWGHIKHTTVGEGSPVLLMHGIFGGFDQGLAIARGNLGGEVRSIVSSRIGSLRTPHPNGVWPLCRRTTPCICAS